MDRSGPASLLILVCLATTFCSGTKEKTPSKDEVYDEMFKLLEEQANLETQVKKLISEVAERRKQLKTGDYKSEVDLSACPKTCPSEPLKPESQAEVTKSTMLASLSDKKKKRRASSARFLGKYPFKTKPMDSINANDPKLIKLLRQGRPVIIKNSNLVKRAIDKWDMNFLVQNIGGRDLAVQLSDTRQFLYFGSEETDFEWTPPFQRMQGAFPHFIDLVEELEQKRNGSYSYFHSALGELSQGPGMREDYEDFNWSWLDKVKPDHWGKLTTNLFILGMPNVVTPAHFDGLQNLFAQMHGYKRCIIFPPGHYKNLYQHPVGHPNERQTQVDFDNPNLAVFPRFPESQGIEAIVGPGDLLYIPSYWYHHIESEMDSMTMSMNFWFTGQNDTSASTKPAVPPKFKSDEERPPALPKEKKAKRKAADDEEEESDSTHVENFNSRAQLQLPEDTYKLDEIYEIMLIADIESVVGNMLGVSRVKQFLHDGFNGRYDLMKVKDNLDDDIDDDVRLAGSSPGQATRFSKLPEKTRSTKMPAEDEEEEDVEEKEVHSPAKQKEKAKVSEKKKKKKEYLTEEDIDMLLDESVKENKEKGSSAAEELHTTADEEEGDDDYLEPTSDEKTATAHKRKPRTEEENASSDELGDDEEIGEDEDDSEGDM